MKAWGRKSPTLKIGRFYSRRSCTNLITGPWSMISDHTHKVETWYQPWKFILVTPWMLLSQMPLYLIVKNITPRDWILGRKQDQIIHLLFHSNFWPLSSLIHFKSLSHCVNGLKTLVRKIVLLNIWSYSFRCRSGSWPGCPEVQVSAVLQPPCGYFFPCCPHPEAPLSCCTLLCWWCWLACWRRLPAWSQTWPSCWEAERDLGIAFSAGCLETWE